MFRILTLLLCILFLSVTSFSQKETNIWYFGHNSGMNFNTSPPTILTDGKIDTREGVAVISDKNSGQLLFYTEGTTVWNRNHLPMPGGTGLQGDYSSTQSSIIVPNPGNRNRYYIFTTAINKGFLYSEVDMTLNGGLGDVRAGVKNIQQIAPSVSTEKLIAARHCNGRDYWVITHTANDDKFYVYLVNAAGVQTPTVYGIGSVLRKTQGDYELTGCLKLSPDASKLANAIGTNMDRASSPVEIFNFDITTGAITGPIVQLSNLASPYGVEFSSNAKLIYVSEITGKKVNQFDLTATNINASKVNLASSASLGYGALQLGPDGKIYVAAENGYTIPYNFLSTINFPNVVGIGCNYQADAVSLGATSALIGLPTFTATFLKDTSGFNYQGSCTNPDITFDLTYSGNVDSVKWDFGDASVKSTALTPSHTYTVDGSYEVKLFIYRKCSINDTIIRAVNTQRLRSVAVSKSICAGSSYVLPDGMAVTQSGIYPVTLKSADGCDSIVTTTLSFRPAPNVVAQVSNDINCSVSQARLTGTGADTYVWTPSANLDNPLIADPVVRAVFTTVYYVKGTDIFGCTGNDSVIVKVTGEGRNVFNLPNAFTPNGDGKNDCFGIIKVGLTGLEEFSIFNRYGNKIFTTKRASDCWDGRYKGKLQDPGGFVYIIKANSVCGEFFRKGIVMLIR